MASLPSFFTGSDTQEDYAARRTILEMSKKYVFPGDNPAAYHFMNGLIKATNAVASIFAKLTREATDDPDKYSSLEMYNILDKWLALSGGQPTVSASPSIRSVLGLYQTVYSVLKGNGLADIDVNQAPLAQLQPITQVLEPIVEQTLFELSVAAQGKTPVEEYEDELFGLPSVWSRP